MNALGGNNPSGGKTWPPARVEKLRTLWAAGHTASEIALILGGGISRNSVISAARRAGCAGRASPIVRLTDEERAKRPHYCRLHPAVITIDVLQDGTQKYRGRQPKQPTSLQPETPRGGFTGFPTLKQGASTAALAGAAERDARRRAEAKSPADVQPRRVPDRSALQIDLGQSRVDAWDGKPVTLELITPKQCHWIISDGRLGAASLMCAAPTVLGRSWCPHHCDRAADKRGMQRVAEKMEMRA